ncbi:MAG TPA: cob(I)yrinic acid a,c-diamide adenosyltransferase [Bacteroidales bacterium]|nr:cob(I)yrinic acid a,c-diamide adenosyltransferase [Bacteroidales bacterium]
MKIYTRTGDEGMTSIIGGRRLSKHHPRIEAYGTVDELIAWMGMLRGIDQKCVSGEELTQIQSVLMACCAVVATDPSPEVPKGVTNADTTCLENLIDRMEKKLPALSSFILPGGHQNASFSNIARCVCRRAERALLRLNEIEKVPPEVIRFINRLSDYLFVLSRCLTYEAGIEEVKWQR